VGGIHFGQGLEFEYLSRVEGKWHNKRLLKLCSPDMRVLLTPRSLKVRFGVADEAEEEIGAVER
jgi:hypothetical protein